MPSVLRSVALALLSVHILPACASDRAACPPCPAPAPPEAAAAKADVKAVARRVIDRVAARDSAGLFALFSGDMKQAVPEAQLAPLVEDLVTQYGAPRDLEPIQVAGSEGRFRVRAERGEWNLEVALDGAGAIGGLLFKPAEPEAPVVRSRLPLGLPFRGTWAVGWGGDTRELNHHVDVPSQRRAADLLVMDERRSTHRGDGRANRDYYAYGKEVLAVADGTVVVVVDGVPDNPPGELNPMMTTGNLVIVDHGAGVHSAYAHLVPGSARVKVGAAVRRGQVLGACGNSGNSSEPHLHFQLMDGPRFEKSLGIEPVFAAVEVTRDGARARQAEYTWRKDDLVHAPGTP